MDFYDTSTWYVNRDWTQQMSVKGKLVATEILWNILCGVNIDARKWRDGRCKEKENGYTISHNWILEETDGNVKYIFKYSIALIAWFTFLSLLLFHQLWFFVLQQFSYLSIQKSSTKGHNVLLINKLFFN